MYTTRQDYTKAHKQLGAASLEVMMYVDKGHVTVFNIISGTKMNLTVAQCEALVANLSTLLEAFK